MADARACDCKHPDTISVDPRTHGGYPFQCKVCGVNFSHRALPAELPPLSLHISPGERISDAAFQAWGRECWDAGRRAGLEEAAKLTPVAPWPDFAGQPIHHGDRLRHPNGDEFVAVRLHGYAEESDAWRAIYDGESVPSRLGLQIGEKGRAVLI